MLSSFDFMLLMTFYIVVTQKQAPVMGADENKLVRG